MEPVTRKRYTAEFKAQAVELVGLGKPVSEVAEDLEIGTNVLYRWVRAGGQPAQLGSAGGRAVGEETECVGHGRKVGGSSPLWGRWRQPRVESNCMSREGVWRRSNETNRSIERK